MNNFIGNTFKTRSGGTLTVMGMFGKVKGVNKYYVHCSICNKDEELFPNHFLSEKGSLLKGCVPCGCSSSPKWSEYQFSVLLTRSCISKNINFNGYVDNIFYGQTTNLNCSCEVCGNNWNTTNVNTMINTTSGCPKCALYEKSKSQRNVDAESIAKTSCDEKGYKFVGFIDEYKNQKSKLKYLCPIHGEITTSYISLVNYGYGCYKCRKTGYSESISGYYYLYLWNNEEYSFIKHGVTNNITKRISKQSRYTNFKPFKILELRFEDGSIPRIIEKIIQEKYETGVVDRLDFPDGFTETLSIENLNQIIEDIKSI